MNGSLCCVHNGRCQNASLQNKCPYFLYSFVANTMIRLFLQMSVGSNEGGEVTLIPTVRAVSATSTKIEHQTGAIVQTTDHIGRNLGEDQELTISQAASFDRDSPQKIFSRLQTERVICRPLESEKKHPSIVDKRTLLKYLHELYVSQTAATALTPLSDHRHQREVMDSRDSVRYFSLDKFRKSMKATRNVCIYKHNVLSCQ